MELGGHLHIDCPNPDMHRLEQVVNMLAYTLRRYHSDSTGSWYRLPGLFRPKPYGLEYRSLGAEWAASPSKRALIFNTVSQYMEAFK
jgi:hypothetical protein